MNHSSCIKNKLKSEILNNNNSKYKPKCLYDITENLNWQISTKNIVTFKKQYGLKMKNFNIMGVHQFLEEGGQYIYIYICIYIYTYIYMQKAWQKIRRG